MGKNFQCFKHEVSQENNKQLYFCLRKTSIFYVIFHYQIHYLLFTNTSWYSHPANLKIGDDFLD